MTRLANFHKFLSGIWFASFVFAMRVCRKLALSIFVVFLMALPLRADDAHEVPFLVPCVYTGLYQGIPWYSFQSDFTRDDVVYSGALDAFQIQLVTNSNEEIDLVSADSFELSIRSLQSDSDLDEVLVTSFDALNSDWLASTFPLADCVLCRIRLEVRSADEVNNYCSILTTSTDPTIIPTVSVGNAGDLGFPPSLSPAAQGTINDSDDGVSMQLNQSPAAQKSQGKTKFLVTNQNAVGAVACGAVQSDPLAIWTLVILMFWFSILFQHRRLVKPAEKAPK